MNATNNIATDLFYKIRSRFSGLKLGTETGEITINPEEARFFDFDYTDGDDAMGHVSISLAEENSIKVYFSTGITEDMETIQKQKWYGFLKELRQFAKRRLMSFDTRDITKDNLDKRDYAFLTQNAKPKEQPNMIQQRVGESIMSESQMYGTKTVSYQKLMDTRLIVKHSHTLNDDMAPGARSRNISALFVENQDGERFKYPFIHLAGARAMQRHVANQGLPYDDIGKSIIGMSEQIAQLRSFSNYVVRNDLMNSDTNSIVEQSKAALESLREQVARMSKQGYYESYKESFQAQQPLEVPQDVVEEFTDKFTVKNFKEDIKSVFPILYKLMKENNTVDYDDIVAMTTTESVNDEAELELEEDRDEFAEFENWVMGLGESSGITSNDQEEQMMAVKGLQDLVAQEFPAGVDGNNAITSLKGIIEDSALYQSIKEMARENPDTSVQPLIKDWLEQNAPEILEKIEFGDVGDEMDATADASAEAVPQEEVPQEAVDPKNPRDYEKPAFMRKAAGEPPLTTKDIDDKDNESPTTKQGLKKLTQRLDVKEVAEFIHSFYDRESQTFPKGPEGVCTMVGKKFGEQAEQAARKMVERMAPQQQAPELQELSRIRELAGNTRPVEAASMPGDQYLSMPADQNKLSLGQQMARDGITYSGDNEQEMIGQIAKYMKDRGDSASTIRYYMNDDDFVADTLSDLRDASSQTPDYKSKMQDKFGGDAAELTKGLNIRDDVNPELESIKRLSGIGQGMGF